MTVIPLSQLYDKFNDLVMGGGYGGGRGVGGGGGGSVTCIIFFNINMCNSIKPKPHTYLTL